MQDSMEILYLVYTESKYSTEELKEIAEHFEWLWNFSHCMFHNFILLFIIKCSNSSGEGLKRFYSASEFHHL
jgi:hypothetical protein